MKRKYASTILIGGLLLAAGLVVPMMTQESTVPSSLLATVGTVLIVLGVVRHLQFGEEPEGDERTKKIGAWGITYSWILTLVLITVVFWVDYLHVAALSLQEVLVLLLFGMIISARLFQWVLFRRGDVE